MKPLPRAALICDYHEEGWHSMDLAADALLSQWGRASAGFVPATAVRPRWNGRVTRVPGLGRRGVARNADRLLNRLWDYPRHVRPLGRQFDIFHVVDHSYSQLVHALPAGRTGVFCHDLDTFRCLLEPRSDSRPRWFRVMARHILSGMQKAAVVFYTTDDVRRQIEHHQLIDATRMVKAPLGVCDEFRAGPGATGSADDLLGTQIIGEPFLLHVGSCIPRKRIDVLLDVFAAARAQRADLRLVKASGEWTEAQREQIRRLGVGASITHLRDLSREQIASLYRRAAIVLQPSEGEGFGLPVIEALACGARVVASDLPVLREVGGPAVMYCPVGDVGAWAGAVETMLGQADADADRAARLAWAARYSWAEHARIVGETYLRIWRGEPVAGEMEQRA